MSVAGVHVELRLHVDVGKRAMRAIGEPERLAFEEGSCRRTNCGWRENGRLKVEHLEISIVLAQRSQVLER